MPKLTKDHLIRPLILKALELDRPYNLGSWVDAPGHPASVLVLIGETHEGWSLLLTKRTEKVETHKGQIAFPGGVEDPSDSSAIHAALRETHEETGIVADCIEVMGALPCFTIPTSGFRVSPVVGVLKQTVSSISVEPNPDEIEELFWVSLEHLLKPESHRYGDFDFRGRKVPTHVFEIGKHQVWGATAAMLHHFIERLRLVLNDDRF